VKIWVDLTNSPHVLVMAPIVRWLRAQGHEVEITARDFAQTLELCRRHGLAHTAIGEYGGAGFLGKARGLVRRSTALLRWARRRGFDLALGHGSNDISVAARVLGIPSATAFDYEWAALQHHINCRLAQAVVVPEAIPPERLARYGARGKLRRYPGIKEEYYLADFEPDAGVLDELGIERDGPPIVVVRTPPEASLYHRFRNPLFADLLLRLEREDAQVVVLPRLAEQRAELRSRPRLRVPERAIDAPSLVALADLVVSAGGTMNREAVALGTPVYTTFEGRLGAVDELLLREGRMRRLGDPSQLRIEHKPRTGFERKRRDPGDLARLMLSALEASGERGHAQAG